MADCDQFNYFIFFLTPTIAFTVVLRVAYVYKSGKIIKHHQPGRFFKGKEIRAFMKRNIRTVRQMFRAMLSMTAL